MCGRFLWLAAAFASLLIAADPSPQRADYQPLTPEQRWETYWKGFVSPGRLGGSAGRALGAQFADDPPEWGQGAEGYGKRFASSYGVFAVQESTEAAVAAALGQDPRYISCDCSGFWKRFGFAVSSTVMTYDNAGDRTFAWGRVGGRYAGSMAAITWFPDRYGWKDGMREGTQRFGFGAAANLVREFMPEIKRVFGLGN